MTEEQLYQVLALITMGFLIGMILGKSLQKETQPYYQAGETLNPNCYPSDVRCTIIK